jgi:hypothetical protein
MEFVCLFVFCLSPAFTLVSCSAYMTLRIEVISGMLVDFQQTRR